MHTVFLRSDAAATIYFAARFVRLLIEGGVWKALRHQRRLDKVRTSIDNRAGNALLSMVRVRLLLDAVSSTRSLSVLLSAVGTTGTTQTVLALAW